MSRSDSHCHASPLTVRVGGRAPWIDATISSTRRVGPTSCTRNIAAPVGGGQRGRRQRALQAFGQVHTQSLPDEVLVAQRHQDRPSGIYKIFYVAQQTKTVISVLAEIVGRIDQHRRPGAPRAATARSAAAVTSAMTSSTTPRSVVVP